MDKLTSIKIRQENNTYSNQIPVSVLAEHIDWDDDYNLKKILGNVNIQDKGNIQYQLNQLFNTKVSHTELNQYILNNLNQNVSNWLDINVDTEHTAIIDKTISVDGAAADAKAVRDNFYDKDFINQEILVKTTGDIKWQRVPQGLVDKNTYTYTITENGIILNGTLPKVAFFIYGQKKGSATGDPKYSSYSQYYFDPCTLFIPGHMFKADIKLISGTYETVTKNTDGTNLQPYLEIGDITNNTSTKRVTFEEYNKYQAVLNFQPQMIAFGVYAGQYDNAVFEISITDLNTDLNIIATNYENKINELIAKTTGEVKWQIPQGTYKKYSDFFIDDDRRGPITIANNTITINGEIPLSSTGKVQIVRFMLYGYKLSYTSAAPTYTSYSNIYYNPISSFVLGHKIKISIKLISGSVISNSTPPVYLDVRNIQNGNANPNPWILNDDDEVILNFQPQMIAFGVRTGIYNNATFEFSITDMDSIDYKLSQLLDT